MYAVAVARTITTPSPDEPEEGPTYHAVHFFKPSAEGRQLVMATDRIESTGWLLVLAFHVGGGTTDLVGHVICAVPEWWRTDVPRRSPWMTDLGELVAWPVPFTSTHLTTAVVRTATTGALERKARAHIARYGPQAIAGGVSPGPAAKSGPRNAGDLRRAQIAARYLELHEETDSPKAALAAELNLSVNTVNSYLFQARERGLLTSWGRGRAGGELTSVAQQLLEAGG